MSHDFLQFAAYALVLMAVSIPLGAYIAKVAHGDYRFLSFIERPIYAMSGVSANEGQNWRAYTFSLIAANLVGFVVLYLILCFQDHLPLNPLGFGGLSPDLAFNTSISFITNTNWQSYSGESTMSFFSQMVGLTTQNFLSAAAGMAVALGTARGLIARQSRNIGNFWVDLTRMTLYVLLPLSILLAIAFGALGMPQTWTASVDATTLDGVKQTIDMGPVASQLAIKQLGTNGGGFFNTNSSHPFENPNALTNFLSMLAILAIPSAFCFTFGRMVNDKRQGYALVVAMAILALVGFGIIYFAEYAQNPLLVGLVDAAQGNMEGKEVRFGIFNSALWATITTAASNGSVNAMHDSLSSIGGLIAMLNIQLGEVVYGGVGVGLTGMLHFVILTVFIAGLMVGRTPEYLGKKIEAKEVKLSALTLLIMPIGILAFSAIAIYAGTAQSSIQNAGPHGLSELLYAYSSATGNNGSAFAGFNANTPWHNAWMGVAMLFGRFGYIITILAIAGSLAAKKTTPPSAGTFPTHGPVFIALLMGIILIIGALTFLPVLALGPIAEHVSAAVGQVF